MSIRTIFFDLDDTLVDHAFARRQAMSDVYDRFRSTFHQVPLDVLDHTFDQVNDKLWAQLSRGEITAGELRTQRFLQTLQIISSLTPLIKYDQRDAFDIDPYFIARYEANTREFPDATRTLESLSRRFTLGVITNGLQDIQSRRLTALGWDPFFTHIVTPDLSGAMKPDDKMFKMAESVSGCSAREIAFVGDSHHYDIAGAQRRGWTTIWFNPRGEESPLNGADIEVSTLAEIPDHFLASVA